MFKIVKLITCIMTISMINTFAVDVDINADMTNELKNMNSPIWEKMHKLDKFFTRNKGAVTGQPQVKTEAAIAFDGDDIYVRIKAFDKSIDKLKLAPAPVDGFLNKFPNGDHVEICIGVRHKYILAFDLNANKYLSKDFAPAGYCWYDLETKKTDYGWMALVTINSTKLKGFYNRRNKSYRLAWNVVRHLDHGADVERSYSPGRVSGNVDRVTFKKVK